jgi:hypothetical protein
VQPEKAGYVCLKAAVQAAFLLLRFPSGRCQHGNRATEKQNGKTKEVAEAAKGLLEEAEE